ncbi:DUF6115 domain-containing protein [Sporosarcina siberiensis]|uniref:DUF6115 domain-containing protein n=1 Tax=Sporosarcina siberiensis TaxID=1365606 RepID=A0ABW4SJ28_9BACL
MTIVFLIIVFMLQIIGFYFLALLYTKVSKFDDLEKKQRKLMEQMDDSIAAYLSEMQDENNRLIQQLSAVELTKESEEKPTPPSVVKTSEPIRVKIPSTPMNLAIKSYGKNSTSPSKIEEVEMDDRTKVLRLHDEGQTIEEIAKALGKGKTEVELILKFK